jgi:hypothetical protein
MYSSAFCNVGLQVYNLKSPNLSLDEVYKYVKNVFQAASDVAFIVDMYLFPEKNCSDNLMLRK